MRRKIKSILAFCLFGGLIFFLVYTRFLNLSWGLPYPIHPDERNMSWALMKLSTATLFKPDFFAYGQFPLYVGFVIVIVSRLVTKMQGAIMFDEAVMSLRFLSACASVLNTYILMRIVFLLWDFTWFKRQKPRLQFINTLVILLCITCVPYAIQFSHFGTTESLLMLFYSCIVYFSLRIVIMKEYSKRIMRCLALVSGMAIATKTSAVLFLPLPCLVFCYLYMKKRFHAESLLEALYEGVRYISLALLFCVILAPYNFIALPEFMGSMRYEGDVALGRYVAFYTRQFENTVPVLFQMKHVFPYVMGWGQYILGVLGILFLPYTAVFIVLRLAFFIYFIPQAFFFTKWARFITPTMPLMTVFAILFLFYLKNMILYDFNKMKIQKRKLLIQIFFYVLIGVSIIPGIAYVSVYESRDVRYQASQWIYEHIPDASYILSETANVVDIPIDKYQSERPKTFTIISFNFYDLDQQKELQEKLQQHLIRADYIFIPSRRIFANHYCTNKNTCGVLQKKYPLLNDYYQKLFNGSLGFIKVAEFSSFPRIRLFGRTLFEMPDEQAEETWTVFDHPVIRIYKRVGGTL